MITSADIRLLTEVGFLAASRADLNAAQAIFRGLELARPATVFPYVGWAMAWLNAGQADEAVAVLDRGLRAVPAGEQGELQAFRALALQLAGRAAESARALSRAGDLPLAAAMRGERETVREGN